VLMDSISYHVKEKSQNLVDLILVGYKYEKALSIAHISHILGNSERISNKFFNKTYKIIKKALSQDRNVINVDSISQHVLLRLIEKFPEKLDKGDVRQLLKDRKIHYKKIKSYLKSK